MNGEERAPLIGSIERERERLADFQRRTAEGLRRLYNRDEKAESPDGEDSGDRPGTR
jgi:hypothetical protein